MQAIQHTLVSSIQKKDLRSLLNRVHLGPRGVKVTVILLFTFCWLLVALVRNNVPRHTAALEESSLPGLATSLQQGAVSGRDFQSVLGPGTQFLASAATSSTKTRSPVDAYGMIGFFFCALGAILIAALLLVCDRLSWQDAVILYAFCFLLNLFFEVLDFRAAMLLLNAAFAYRITAATTMRQRVIWATATGLLSFLSQLITFELGVYAVVVVVCALIAGSVLMRSVQVLLGIEVFVATLAAVNIALVIFFKLTSANYGLVFDYYNYSLEILRGFHNSMGILWQLPLSQTVVLALTTSYVIGRCIMLSTESNPLDASLFASLALAAVVWVKSAFVISDIPHITGAFTPTIVVLSLLSTKEWRSAYKLSAWALTVCALLFVWPSLSLSAPVDILNVIRGEVRVGTAIRNLYVPQKPLTADLLPSWITSDLEDRGGIPVLAFPYDQHIGAGVLRPFSAPVLDSYAASTVPLEQYYIQALDRQRGGGLDIIYGSDERGVPEVGGIHAITRTPNIFEYLYRNFELVSSEDHVDGHYRLRERYQPRDVAMEELQFSIPQQSVDSGILKLSTPSNCGLLRVEVQIEYAKSPLIFRPSGIEMNLSDGNHLVWQGSVSPLEPDHMFVTFLSPLPAATFHKVFSQEPVPSIKWDTIEYRNLPVDVLGSRARRIQVERLHCIDPKKFAEATPAGEVAIVR
jgi:hypothetical protein